VQGSSWLIFSGGWNPGVALDDITTFVIGSATLPNAVAFYIVVFVR